MTERRSRKPLVLCVDDEPPVLSALRRVFRGEPYEILTTEEPAQALDWMEDEEVNVLITDQRMPEMVGTQLLQAARRRRPAAVCVILTGYPESVIGDYNLVISKPWSDEDLRRTIRKLLHQQQLEEGQRGALRRRPAERRVRVGGADLAEVLVRLDCDDADLDELAPPLDAAFDRAAEERRDALVVLESLESLEGSVVHLLRSIVERAEDRRVLATILDGSGLASTYLKSFEEPPVIAYGPDADSRRVLVVSAREETRNALGSVLEPVGHVCMFARTAPDVIRQLDEGQSDLVVLDLAMPDGATIAKRILDRGRLRIVGISAWEDLWDPETRERYGIRNLLPRPFRVSEVFDAVHGRTPPAEPEEEVEV